jgi:hypothetical protein
MKMFSTLKVAKYIAWFGVILALSMLGKSLIHYQVLGGSLENVKSLAPLERDIPSEIVMPLVASRNDADSILKLVRSPHESNKMLHKAWLQSVELHRSEAFIQIFLWVVLMVSFFAIAISLSRRSDEL